MTPADLATANAIHFEGVKNAYRQTKDGVVISFVVHPHDVPKGLAEAPLGSRYIVALVQVGDDEQPIQKEVMPDTPKLSKSTPTDARPLPAIKSAGAKRDKMDWRELQPAAQAGIRCEDPVFKTFLLEKYPDDWHACEYNAADFVRHFCGVKSRSELSSKHASRMVWKQLDDQFLAWKHVDA